MTAIIPILYPNFMCFTPNIYSLLSWFLQHYYSLLCFFYVNLLQKQRNFIPSLKDWCRNFSWFPSIEVIFNRWMKLLLIQYFTEIVFTPINLEKSLGSQSHQLMPNIFKTTNARYILIKKVTDKFVLISLKFELDVFLFIGIWDVQIHFFKFFRKLLNVFFHKIFIIGSQLSPDESRREGSKYSRNESAYPKNLKKYYSPPFKSKKSYIIQIFLWIMFRL